MANSTKDFRVFAELKCKMQNWTFTTKAQAAYSSMTRDNFLGFGCSATTLLKKQFKLNTFAVPEYIRSLNHFLHRMSSFLPNQLPCNCIDCQYFLTHKISFIFICTKPETPNRRNQNPALFRNKRKVF